MEKTPKPTPQKLKNPEDVRYRRDQVLSKYQGFKEAARQRREKLEAAKKFQQFKRDASELEAWINEKIHIVSNDSYKDRTNLQGKIQKHQTFEAELAAHNNVIHTLKSTGKSMIDQQHFAATQIRAQLDNLSQLWQKLIDTSTRKRKKLQDAQTREHFVQKADEVSTWISDREAVASSEEVGKDLEHVKMLQKNFADFMKDLQANESSIAQVNQIAEKLLADRHPDADLIRGRQDSVNEGWSDLRTLAKHREEKLAGASEIQKYNRDADETKSWMDEKETALLSDDYGRDLASVQALQRKHEGLERDLAALEDKVKVLQGEVKRLQSKHPDNADKIAAKQAEIVGLWEGIKRKASKRGTRLEDALQFQKFLGDCRELFSWVKDTSALIVADELAKDVAGAEALLQRHRERREEIDAQDGSFKTTSQFGQSLIASGHFASDEIKEKLESLASDKMELLKLWKERKEQFGECMELQLFMRDAYQADNWIAKQEAFLAIEDVGDSLEAVEALISKHGNFEKSLTAQEEKFKALEEMVSVMMEADHYATTEAHLKKDEVMSHRVELEAHAEARRSRLEQSLSLQQCLRDTGETKNWIADKTKMASDEAYKDPTNLEAKLQHQQDFESELQANKGRVDSAIQLGRDLIEGGNFASGEIQSRLDELQALWAELENRSVDKGRKLQEAQEQQQFYRAVKDADLWLDEVEKQLSSDDLGKDLPGVQKLQKRLNLLEMDIIGHQNQIDALSSQVEAFEDSGHFDSANIQERQLELISRYDSLQAPLSEQKSRLEASQQLQQFFRDVEDEESWIKERKPVAASSNTGYSVTFLVRHVLHHQ